MSTAEVNATKPRVYTSQLAERGYMSLEQSESLVRDLVHNHFHKA